MYEDDARPFPGTCFAQRQHSLAGAVCELFWDATDEAQAGVPVRNDVTESYETTEVLILATAGQVVVWRTTSDQQTPLLEGICPSSNGCELRWQGTRNSLPMREVLRDASLACRRRTENCGGGGTPFSTGATYLGCFNRPPGGIPSFFEEHSVEPGSEKAPTPSPEILKELCRESDQFVLFHGPVSFSV